MDCTCPRHIRQVRRKADTDFPSSARGWITLNCARLTEQEKEIIKAKTRVACSMMMWQQLSDHVSLPSKLKGLERYRLTLMKVQSLSTAMAVATIWTPLVMWKLSWQITPVKLSQRKSQRVGKIVDKKFSVISNPGALAISRQQRLESLVGSKWGNSRRRQDAGSAENWDIGPGNAAATLHPPLQRSRLHHPQGLLFLLIW